MVFADARTKAQRLLAIQRMFWRAPGRPRSTREIAREIGAAERSVRKYLTELSASGDLPVYYEGRRWRLVEGARMQIPPVRFLLEEAAAVYLAARLLLQQADEPNPAVGGAIAKLAAVVPEELRPAFDHLVQRTASAGDRDFAEHFRTLAFAWALSRVVTIVYRARSRPEPFECSFRPYLLEPSAVGSALYVIGRMDPPGELRVLKAERIVSVRATRTTFVMPPVEEILDRLERSWGVWISDQEPVEVHLRFSPDLAGRVRETRWHPSQRLAPTAGGGVEIAFTVTSTVELVPWILGWGAGCEVLAPEDLRRRIAAEHRRAADRYR